MCCRLPQRPLLWFTGGVTELLLKSISSPNLPELPGVEGPDGRNKRREALLLWGSLKAVPLSSSCCSRPNAHHQPLSSVQSRVVVWPSNLSGLTGQSVKSWGNILTSCMYCVVSCGLVWLKEPSNITVSIELRNKKKTRLSKHPFNPTGMKK